MANAASCSCTVGDRRIPPFLLDNLVRQFLQPPRRFLSRHVGPGDRVADLGCGAGHFAVPMTRLIGDDGCVFAVDFDPRAIARLRRKVARAGASRVVNAHVASAAEIDFIEAGSLDFVLAEGLLCCMTDHEGVMRQIRRVLGPKGRAWISVMKGGRESDPRTVTAREWTSLLSGMRVLESGGGLFTRWALVSPRVPAR